MDITQQYFTCKKCGVSKIWGEFVKNQKTKHGILYKCRKCYNDSIDPKAKAEKYAKNKERIQQQRARYYQRNKESIKKKAEEYRLKLMREDPATTREKSRIKMARWRGNNRERDLLNQRKWRRANRSRARVYEKTYMAKNPMKTAEKWRRKRESARDRITSAYVKSCLVIRGFTRGQADQNPELINIQRIIIQTKRLCKT